jgi:hypothetical protein
MMNRMDIGTSVHALNTFHKALSLLEYSQQLVTIAARGAAGDWLGVVTELVGVDLSELGDIIDKLKEHGLSDLSASGLQKILAQSKVDLPVITFELDLPDTGKVGRALRMARTIFGGARKAQEFIGELGTAIMFHVLGFKESGLTRAHSVWGPDGIVRHQREEKIWAIYEAKGGTSKLGTSTLSRPAPPPAGMTGLVPGRVYPQFGARWLEFWLRKTIEENRGTDAGDELRSAFGGNIPMFTGVVSVNLNRVNEELKFAAQVFLPPNGAGFNEWPKGF